MHDALINGLIGGGKSARDLNHLMKEPGFVQIACAQPKLYIPAGMFYDYTPFDKTMTLSRYELCGEFLAAPRDARPLIEHRCFKGE
jgi:hypothetical protein